MAERKWEALAEKSGVGGASGVDAMPREIRETIVELLSLLQEIRAGSTHGRSRFL